MNLPNKITLWRIALIPVFIAILLMPGKEWWAAVFFVILALSDILDGHLARKHKLITKLGTLADPLADKLLVSAALIFLIGNGVDAWIAFVIIAREFAVTGLRLVLSDKKTISASVFGKIKTLSQIVAVVGVIINVPFAYHLLLVAVAITVISGIDYYLKNAKFISK